MNISRSLIVAAAAVLFCVGVPGTLRAAAEPTPSPTPKSTPSPSPSPDTIIVGNDESEPVAVKPEPVDYVFPELSPKLTTFNNKAFMMRIGVAVITDYTFVGQDARSLSQVGKQDEFVDLRAGRIVFAGIFKFKKPWTYLFGMDVNERPKPGHSQALDLLDYNLTIPLWKSARVTIGKQKEPFIYEMVGDAAFLPQQERILSPFFVSREVGIKYSDNFLKDRIGLSVGVFNSWEVQKVAFNEGAIHVAARLTGTPIMSKNGREYLHIGGGYRYAGNDLGTLRLKGRPESNTIDNYVDTGSIKANYSNAVSAEALYAKGGYSLLTEYVHAWVSSPVHHNPGFNGFYVTGSWVITGETRPYDAKATYARRIVPRSRWGAVEAVARYSYLDLDDKTVRGGTLNKLYLGMNWWASLQWKFGVGYGFSSLDRSNTVGHTHALHLRAQWVF